MGILKWLARAMSFAGGSAHAFGDAGVIVSDSTLLPGQCWRSANRRVVLAIDRAGRLTLKLDGNTVWNPTGTATAAKLVFDAQGALTLYDPDGYRMWMGGITGQAPACLHIQDDGNVVIYRNHFVVWASGTCL